MDNLHIGVFNTWNILPPHSRHNGVPELCCRVIQLDHERVYMQRLFGRYILDVSGCIIYCIVLGLCRWHVLDYFFHNMLEVQCWHI